MVFGLSSICHPGTVRKIGCRAGQGGGYNFAAHVSDPIYWDDAYPIALLLRQTRPIEDPLSVSLEQLRDWVVELAGFSDDRDALPVDCLEQILSEWVELRL